MAIKAKHTHYAYRLPDGREGITHTWKECEAIVKGVFGARYQGFRSEHTAKEWLENGAQYEKKRTAVLKPGIYFDAGTGRGNGVEISVTNERGEDLLADLLPKKSINTFGKHLLGEGVTNNYGELLACRYALELAMKKGVKKVFGDSALVINYWSKGFIKKSQLPQKTVLLAEEVEEARERFEARGGKLAHISGDNNPADLGFH